MNNDELKENCRHRHRQILGLLKLRETTNQTGKIIYQLTDEEFELVVEEMCRIKAQWNLANDLPFPDFYTYFAAEEAQAKCIPTSSNSTN